MNNSLNARFPSNTNYSSFHVISMTKHQSHITDVCLLTTHQEDGGLKSCAPLWLFLFCHGKLSSSENPLSTVTKETIYWEYFHPTAFILGLWDWRKDSKRCLHLNSVHIKTIINTMWYIWPECHVIITGPDTDTVLIALFSQTLN